MRPFTRRITTLITVPMMLMHGVAQAVVQMIEVNAGNNEVTVPLPAGIQEVELAQQRAGNCRFGRSWGYDLTSRQLWASQGCSGVFKLTIRDDAVPATGTPGSTDSSNAAAGLAAMAAIAGVAILASQGNKHHQDAYYPPPANNGYYPPPPPPPPPPQYGGGYNPQMMGPSNVVRSASGLCMDMQGGPVRPGTPMSLFPCHGRGNQQFARSPRGEIVVGGLCLDVAGRNLMNGAQIVSFPCDGSPTQQWVMSGAQIRNMRGGLCMDVANNNNRQGAPVIAWGCHGGQNQRWFW